jgi:hypothetical protein
MTSVLDCVASGGFLRCQPCPSLKRRARPTIRGGELRRRPAPASDLLAVATALVHRRRHQGRLAASKRHADALAPMRPEHHRAPVVELGGGVEPRLLDHVPKEVQRLLPPWRRRPALRQGYARRRQHSKHCPVASAATLQLATSLTTLASASACGRLSAAAAGKSYRAGAPLCAAYVHIVQLYGILPQGSASRNLLKIVCCFADFSSSVNLGDLCRRSLDQKSSSSASDERTTRQQQRPPATSAARNHLGDG